MGLNPVVQLLTAAAVLFLGFWIFRIVVRRDYQLNTRLSPPAVFLETAIFFIHGMASYAFLDSRLGQIKPGNFLFWVAVLLLVAGLFFVLLAMSRLGWGTSVGQDHNNLRQAGFYRYTRNPQIVAYLAVVMGYALMWPSWPGLIWVGLYLVIAHLMVLTEEEHLRRVYGQAYLDYCRRTPRYLGAWKS